MVRALFWKLMERFGVQGIQFVLQLILARILAPEHYGILSMMIVFVNLANVFTQRGFNTALIQNKDVTEEDYSSVFWVTLGIALVLYAVIYFSAPAIAAFYNMQDIIIPLRVLALTLLPGAINSIQLAKVSRELDFKKVFYGSVGGILIAGIAGVAVAFMGGGLWALVVQNLLKITMPCVVMFFTVQWRPVLVCNLKRVGVLLQYGWKLLVSSLLDTLTTNIYSLVIGKKYDSGTLGYYNRGDQFPQFILNAVNGAMSSVLLPAMSANQDKQEEVKAMTKNSMVMSCYIIFPMMAGLAAVATPLIRLLLTEKWLPAVPYLQVNCFIYAFYTVYTCNLQAMNAVGRSDWFLKLEIIKKIYTIALLIVAVSCFDSPMAIVMMGAVTVGLDWYVNCFPNKNLINYSYWEQIKDILPLMLLTALMMIIVLLVGFGCTMASLADSLTLILQVSTGVIVYLLLSVMFKPYPYRVIMKVLKDKRAARHS